MNSNVDNVDNLHDSVINCTSICHESPNMPSFMSPDMPNSLSPECIHIYSQMLITWTIYMIV